jgi:hypothetical protein
LQDKENQGVNNDNTGLLVKVGSTSLKVVPCSAVAL